ncbi:MAG: nitroreductase family protein [Verrucomicrobia bacterium]|nr:nitroreductase family protein [Verrucomicrobiota bacterium]
MNVLDAIHARQSIRAYRPQTVEPHKLETVLEAANRAASAANLQAYQIHVVRRQAAKDALAAAAAGQKFLATAPVVLVFAVVPARSAAKYGARGEQVYAMQDACAAVCNAMLAAVELGLGTCWVDAVDEAAAGRAAGLPPGQRAAVLLPIGYPAENPPRTPRRPLSDLVTDPGSA